MCSKEASVDLGLDNQYLLYGEAIPIIDRMRGGGCGCAGMPAKPGQMLRYFGGYHKKMAEKVKKGKSMKKHHKAGKKTKQTGGARGGPGYYMDCSASGYIAGDCTRIPYPANGEPILTNGNVLFQTCPGSCVGGFGIPQNGGSEKKSMLNVKMPKMTKSKMHKMNKKSKKSHKRHSKKKMNKKHSRKSPMAGGAMDGVDFRSCGSKQQPYPFDGASSVLEIDPSLLNRQFDGRQPEWTPVKI